MNKRPEYGRYGSDLHDIERIFTNAGVGFTVGPAEPHKDFPTTRYHLTTAGGMGDPTERTMANQGYLGFFSAFGFNAEGELLWVGAWE